MEECSSGTVVRLHASEVPSTELIEIHDSILVQIEVDESIIKLLLVQLSSEFFRESSQFLLINSTRAIFVKLSESWLDIVFLHLGVLGLSSFKGSNNV